jgi:hypothetical protein
LAADHPPTDLYGSGDAAVLSMSTAERLARHYLALAGLAAKGSQLYHSDVNGFVYHFEFRIESPASEKRAANGSPGGRGPSGRSVSARLARVDVSRCDGSLEFLFNRRRVRSSPAPVRVHP